MATTYNNLYMDIRQILIKELVPQASLEARELVCYASGKTREALVNDYQKYVPEAVEEEVYYLLKRRLQGEPLAYLIGKWDFYGYEFLITPDVLIPRVDTEVLAEAAIECAEKALPGVRILDLCAGSGCIGITISIKVPSARVILCDISEGAVRLCRQNIRKHERTGYISCITGDILLPPPASIGTFDIIVCNPPYIPTGQIMSLDKSVAGYEPRIALDGGVDGLRYYRALAKGWKDALRLGGSMLLECGAGQMPAVKAIFTAEGFVEPRVLKDTHGIERVLIVKNGDSIFDM